jgi:hypothetical protein
MNVLSAIPTFDRRDHPSVPTAFRGARRSRGGQGWPKATAKRREASLRATEPPCDPSDREGPFPRFRFPLSLQGWEAEVGSLSKSLTATLPNNAMPLNTRPA